MAKKVSASEKLKAMKESQIKRKIQISGVVGLIVYLLGLIVYLLGILPSYFPSDIRIQISLLVTGLGLLLFALVRPVWLWKLWKRIKRLSTLRSLDFVAKRK